MVNCSLIVHDDTLAEVPAILMSVFPKKSKLVCFIYSKSSKGVLLEARCTLSEISLLWGLGGSIN